MDFYEVLDQVIDLLKQRGRASYRALKVQFNLDDESLEALKEELVEVHQLAIDHDSKMLVWAGETDDTPTPVTQPVQSEPQPVVEPAQTTSVESPQAQPHTPEAERRQLTVMFCDLVDSTALSGRLDPEDLRDVIKAYQAACTEVIQRYDGHVAQLLGDGLLVYFGYPRAHEDDAQRAIHAGLGMLDAIGALNHRLEREQRTRLAMRVGIHTGLVVVGEMGGEGRQEPLALGETPNVAARVQGLAEPDTVVISHATHELAQGYFEYETLGEHLLRGVAEPMVVHRVLHASGVQSRLDIASTRGLTPLVGRESEVALMLDRWGQVQDGRRQVVLLSGAAGIGKSRLVQVLKEHVATTPHTRLECRSSPYYQHTALYPITDLLQRTIGWRQIDTVEVKLRKLEEALGRYRFGLEETVPLFAALLSLPVPEDRYAPLNFTPQRQRQKTLETLVTMLVKASERQPVLFIIEDLHWTDATTLEMLELLFDQSATASILTLLTCRPEFEPTWSRRLQVTEVSLSRLSRRQVEQMAERVAHGKHLPGEIMRELIEKTDGVPLYLEEITKVIIESGMLKEHDDHYELAGSVASLTIPATLHDSLMARLDRMANAKGVAQLGAVIGRTFSYDLLEAITSLDASILQQNLQLLVEAELVFQRGLPPQATYTFKHALIQDAAYQSLLRSTRQQYHRQIVELLEAKFPETLERQPELAAHHYSEAGLYAQAIPYWHHAGLRAVERSAYVEALAHLMAGLALLPQLPDTPARTQQELVLQLALGPVLAATKGNAAPEVGQAYRRARSLCQELGDTPHHFPVLVGLWRFAWVQDELLQAHELGLQLLDLAERARDAELLLEAQRALGCTLFFLGNLSAARLHLEQGVRLYHPEQHGAHAALYGRDPGVDCHAYMAMTLGLIGYPDQALTHMHTALTLAEQLASPLSRGWVLAITGMLHQFHHAWQLTQEWSAEAIELAHEHHFPQISAMGSVLHGWACAIQGEEASGVAEMHQGLADWQATGAVIARPYFLALLADWHGKVGQGALGLQVLVEARDTAQHYQERFYEAEFYRLEGELLLTQAADCVAEAADCFQQALTIARRQQAKWWELRAATSLATLWQQQGKRQEAHDLLAPVYGWFTEGFDTVDLKEAKALLETLGRSSHASA